MKTQVPAACFVGRSCRLSRKELLLIWEQKLRQQESSAVPSVEAGIAVQLQLWEPESGRKACREGLRRVSHNWSGGSCPAGVCQAFLLAPAQ